jgi:hypothetical protein
MGVQPWRGKARHWTSGIGIGFENPPALSISLKHWQSCAHNPSQIGWVLVDRWRNNISGRSLAYDGGNVQRNMHCLEKSQPLRSQFKGRYLHCLHWLNLGRSEATRDPSSEVNRISIRTWHKTDRKTPKLDSRKIDWLVMFERKTKKVRPVAWHKLSIHGPKSQRRYSIAWRRSLLWILWRFVWTYRKPHWIHF